MNERESLLQELHALQLRLEALENGRENLTFDALYKLRKDMDALRARIDRLETGQARHAPVRRTPMPTERMDGQRQQIFQGKLSEANVGKYGTGVLAAVLILLAVTVAVRSFWWIIPASVKFLVIFSVGAGMTVAGEFFLLKRDSGKNGFWQSIAGCGAGITFCTIASGNAIWNLYETAVAGILFFAWFAIHVYLSYRDQSRVFYLVSYIGGFLSVGLATLSAGSEPDIYQQAELAAMIAAILSVGIWSSFKRKDWFLWLLNTLFCLLSLVATSWPAYHLKEISVLSVTRAGLCLLALLFVQSAFPARVPLRAELRIVATFLLASEFSGLVRTMLSPRFGDILSLLILTALWFALGREWPVSAGLAPVCALLLGSCSFVWQLPPCLLPLLVSAGIFAVPSVHQSIQNKIPAILFYLPGFFMIQTEKETAILTLCALAVVLPSLIDYAVLIKYPGPWSLTERTAMVVLMFAGVWNVFPDRDRTESVILLLSVICVLFHRHLALWKYGGEDRTDKQVADVLCIFHLMLSHSVAYWLSFDVSGIDAALVSLSLVSMSTMVIYRCATQNKNMPVTAGAVVLCHFNLWRVVTTCSGGDTTLLVCVLGLLFSAGLVSLGFLFRRKNLRVSGLISMIVYVVWITWSVSFRHGSAATVVMLLLGGLACFGISFAYNRLSRIFDPNDSD